MTGHDELCPWPAPNVEPEDCAYCELIFSTRVDERERIAQAIEAAPVPDFTNHAHLIWRDDAARIARKRGQR